LEYTIGSITLPSSRLLPLPKGRHDLSAKKEGEPAFVVQPEIRWTFEKEEKVISKGVSALGTGIVVAAPLAVWAVTVRLIPALDTRRRLIFCVPAQQGGQIVPNLKTQSPSITSILFLLSLVGLEALILKYWINWRLYNLLPPFIALGLVSAYIGKVALGQVQKKRIAAQTGTDSRASVIVQEVEVEKKEATGKATKVGVVKAK
jgi:oligosaccharyltransferase complex subunit delta (ribophorin II)